jgi:hypothetical protein
MDSDDDDDPVREHYAMLLVNVIITSVIVLCRGLYNKRAFHQSILTGYAWVLELLSGHPEYLRCELGVRPHVFQALLITLRGMGYHDTRHVKLEEQLAIFLYACVTGLTVRHLAGRFQRSNETIVV